MRRLREDKMLEPEISPTGDVLVEGHHVGDLQGFRFTADRTAEGEDAKAIRAAAQKALAQEFDKRADRFANCANGDLALSSEGVVRWLGAPVATLTASDDILKPRAVILADEQLTGPSRDKVAARVDRFVAYQIETHLKPLFDLKAAADLSGMARGIAFQLVEALGILNRRDVAEDVRGLDQDARAALRKLGVRFGAFHIFVPALLKPAPAGLVTMLWALANDAKDRSGFGDVVAILAAGRTSVAADPTFDPNFYRLGGFRLLGKRAVRVDILERLADLIRPALSWKPGTGARPEGALDGNVFLVTPAMMSILGATAADMEEILKGLGYRAEPKPESEVKARIEALETAAAPAAPAEAPGEAVIEAAAEDVGEAVADEVTEPAAEAIPAPETEQTAEPVTEVASEPAVQETPTAEAAPAEPEEDKIVLLWRPGRPEGRPRHQNRRPQRGREGGQPPREAAGDQQQPGGRPRDQQRHARPRDGEERRERPKGGGFKGKGQRPERGDRPRKDERPGGDKRNFTEQRAPRREADPDSPFAKLAALRDQLKK